MFEMWQLERKKKKLGRGLSADLKWAKKEQKPEGDMLHKWKEDFDFVNEQTDGLLSRQLIREAYKLDIPTPPYSDKLRWKRGEMTGEYILANDARHEFRSLIRREKLHRSELKREWFKVVGPFIAALTGLIGALIGLVALLQK